MATFQIFQSSGQYWYHLRADNGEIVQSGEGYTSKAPLRKRHPER